MALDMGDRPQKGLPLGLLGKMDPLGGGKAVEEHEEIGLGIKPQDLPQDPLGSSPDSKPFVDDGDLHREASSIAD
jgi:hypothetical protein